MAEVLIKGIPDGDICNGCRYLMSGTILCTLFDQLCEEKYPKIMKHSYCPTGEEKSEPVPENKKLDYGKELEKIVRGIANEEIAKAGKSPDRKDIYNILALVSSLAHRDEEFSDDIKRFINSLTKE